MSQTTSALLALRELLLSGELAGGERLLEVPLAERLGMSRTPVRTALARLAAEGLLEELTYGGYVVRRFGETDVHEAIEMRGALEGLAARFAAEKKPTAEAIAPLAALLDRIDAVLGAPQIGEDDFEAYVELNARFHVALMDLADSPALAQQLARVCALPFASPSGFVMAQPHSILVVAQHQHRCVLEAIVAHDAARAESLMREHARLARRNLQLAADAHEPLRGVAGAALIELRRQA